MPRVLLRLLGLPAFYFSVMAIPITLTFALLRYRLWDVDAVINRSLVYGALTGALLIVYFVSVAVLQQVVQTLTGEESNLCRGRVDAGARRSLPAAAPAHPDRPSTGASTGASSTSAPPSPSSPARCARSSICRSCFDALVDRTSDLLDIAHGAVFLVRRGAAADTEPALPRPGAQLAVGGRVSQLPDTADAAAWPKHLRALEAGRVVRQVA